MSTTSDRLGAKASELSDDLKEMGDIVRDAAREKLGEVRENATEYFPHGRDNVQATVVATLADAQVQIRLLIQQLSPQVEQQLPPDGLPLVMKRAHPSNYPSSIDVRPALQRVPSTGSADSADSSLLS
jgi:hypothetical protein